jgi:hypothetical protein
MEIKSAWCPFCKKDTNHGRPNQVALPPEQQTDYNDPSSWACTECGNKPIS